MERVVLDIGDLLGKPALNALAYHHVNVDAQKKQLTVEMNQVARSALDQETVKTLFKDSPYVRSADLIFDPEDLTTSLILDFNTKTKVEVFHLVSPEDPSRIVIDILPLKRAARG